MRVRIHPSFSFKNIDEGRPGGISMPWVSVGGGAGGSHGCMGWGGEAAVGGLQQDREHPRGPGGGTAHASPQSGLFRKSEFTDKALEMNGPPSKYGPDVAWPGGSQAAEVWESHALFSRCQRVRGPVKFL